jgi:hypothetical protein
MSAAKRKIEVASIRSSDISRKNVRLDSSFYRGEFADASQRLQRAGLPIKKIGNMATAFVPGRLKLVTSPSSAAGAPYIRAHDAFETRPRTGRFVSRRRTKNYDELLLKEGMILTPSSGRNLGPVAYVGSYLTKYAMTDIMRIVPNSPNEGFYLLAYLLTSTAQLLIKRGRSGTTVDHLSPADVLNMDIPWISDSKIRSAIINDIRRAEGMIDEGRFGLDKAADTLHRLAGLTADPPSGSYLSRKCGDAFSLGDLATLKTLDRYVRFYVEAPNGRQSYRADKCFKGVRSTCGTSVTVRLRILPSLF